MYKQYWNLKEKPFENTPDPRFIFLSNEHMEATRRLLYSIEENKGAALLTGIYGCGKTIISRLIFEMLPQEKYEIGVVTNPLLPPLELLREICHQLDLPCNNGRSKSHLLQSLNSYLYSNLNNNKNTVIMIDEAHTIKNISTFEELRLLLNFQLNDRFLMTLILLGQTELNEKIDGLKALRQRLATRYHLVPLNRDETEQYISHRLNVAGSTRKIFSTDAVHSIWESTEGIPRGINTVCDTCLLIGFAKNAETVDREIVKKAILDLEY
ncbi:MAG: AAA family ATPase [Candidatus Aminicenantes bacterium]|nr:AAA family ATPase [Candidatus Aminicenantes bacterium]